MRPRPLLWLGLVLAVCWGPPLSAATAAVLRADVGRGVLPQERPDPGWLPVRIVFAFAGENYTARLQVDAEALNAAGQEMLALARPKDLTERLMQGLAMAHDRRGSVAPLAQALRAAAPAQDAETLAALALAFVQSLPYALDAQTTPFDDAWRAPIQSLVDTKIDCEDSSILYAALLANLKIEGALVLVPSHLLTAVAGRFSGDYFVEDGKRWYAAETTGLGWPIGKLPPEFANAKPLLVPIAPAAGSAEPRPVRFSGGGAGRGPAPQPEDAPAGADEAPASTVVLSGLLLLALGVAAWTLWPAVTGTRREREPDPPLDPRLDYDNLPPLPAGVLPEDDPHASNTADEIDYDTPPPDDDDFDLRWR